MKLKIIYLKLLFFFSGSACLIYEVVWTRVYADIVGSTAIATTSVFACFLLFLALGAQLFGRFNVYGKKALVLYGIIELGIVLSGLLTSALLLWGRSHIAIYRPESISPAIFYDLATVGLLMGIPVILMGATLPVILNASKALLLPRTVVTQLYGWNTLGGASGTIAVGFFLIWKFGIWGAILTAVGINGAIGFVALCLGSYTTDTVVPLVVEETRDNRREKIAHQPFLWPVLAWLSGFFVLGYEVLWGRMAKFLLGDRTIAISMLLAVFITCLGIGSLISGPLRRRFGTTTHEFTRLIAWILIICAAIHLAMVPVARMTISGGGLTELIPFENEFLRRLLSIWLLLFLPSVAIGTLFPLVVSTARHINTTPGRVVGNLYIINSVGAVFGAFCIVCTLSSLLGTLGGFLLLSLLLLVTGVVLLWFWSPSYLQRTVSVVALCSGLLVVPVYPKSMVELRDDETLIAAHEDEYGVQVLSSTQRNTLRIRNNRLHLIYELGHPQTSYAQQMAAHLTVLLADQCERVINIGTGYGITAGAFTLYPEVRLIETIEILPFLIEQQPLFGKFNFSYTGDPRVEIKQGDGRHYLTRSCSRYDIISVNVLDPYLPGSSSLYSVDFWEIAREHLRSGGVYTQLLWGEDVSLLVKGMQKVFPVILFFSVYGGTAYNVVAFKEPLDQESVRLHHDRINSRVASIIREFTRDEPITYFTQLISGAWYAQRTILQKAIKTPDRCHSDNFPILEYRWAHGRRGVSVLDSPLIVE